MLKKNFFLAFFFIVSISFSQVVTSKKEAIRKGIYEKPADKTVAVAINANAKTVATTSIGNLSKSVAIKSTKPAAAKSAAKKPVINDKPDNDLILEPLENYMALQMINNAMGFIGVHYRGGGTSKDGMDCSGMVTAVFNIFGVKLPRSSNDMSKIGEKLAQSDIRKGDLIFFRTNGKDTINHVGMVIENDGDEIKFIHSSTQKGVIISSTKEPYYKKTFAQANRVIL